MQGIQGKDSIFVQDYKAILEEIEKEILAEKAAKAQKAAQVAQAAKEAKNGVSYDNPNIYQSNEESSAPITDTVTGRNTIFSNFLRRASTTDSKTKPYKKQGNNLAGDQKFTFENPMLNRTVKSQPGGKSSTRRKRRLHKKRSTVRRRLHKKRSTQRHHKRR